jgi:hypothetical protein
MWSILAAEWPAAVYVPSESPHVTVSLPHDLAFASSPQGIVVA